MSGNSTSRGSDAPDHEAARTLREDLEALYSALNRREYVHPDPIEFLYAHSELRDREIVGLVAATLAYGRVRMILRSVAAVLDRMGPEPSRFVAATTPAELRRIYAGFRHRFATGDDIAAMLVGAAEIQRCSGTMGARFAELVRDEHETVLPALGSFVQELVDAGGGPSCHLLPSPERGSACKRFHLYLRWMVRKDAIDPGGWEGIPPSKLVVPLDVHMHRMALKLGFTRRRQADQRTALEVTGGLKLLSPDDPVKYDFAMTRLGIRGTGGVEVGLPRFEIR
jgi:uncharacterized protein (TIGR02757 family)